MDLLSQPIIQAEGALADVFYGIGSRLGSAQIQYHFHLLRNSFVILLII